MEDEKEDKVFNDLKEEYDRVCEKVRNGNLSVNTVVKLHHKYRKYLRVRLPESIIYEGQGDRFYCDREGYEYDKDNRNKGDPKEDDIDDEEDDKNDEEEDDEQDDLEEYIKLTILHMSLYLNDPKFFDYLVDNNADLHKSTKHFGPILHCCIMKGAHDHFQKLVDADVEENLRAYIPQISCSCTPLELAVLCADSRAIEFLVMEAGCSAFLEDSYGCTTVQNIAAYYGHNNILTFLLKFMCNVNLVSRTRYRSMSPLLAAVGSPHADAETVKTLLHYPGININIVNDEGRSALHEFFYHRSNGNLQVLYYLLIAGINVNVFDNDGNLPINEWSWYRNQNYLEAWIILIKHLVKLKTAGLYVCDGYSDTMENEYCDILQVTYSEEVKRLKKVLIPGTQSSYFDLVLLNFDPQRESTLPRSDINFYVISQSYLRKTFPYFAESLIYRLTVLAIAQGKMEVFELFPENKPPIFTL